MNENLKKLISSGAIKRAREEDEAKARNEEIRRNQRMENFEDFSEHYGTKPKNVDTTTSTTSTTRFDSTAKRNNNYKAAQTGSESAFAVEEAAPSSIKKASRQKAGFESYTPKAVNEKAIDERKKREQNARTVNKTVNSDSRDNAKQLQKKIAQLERQEAADKAVDDKYGNGTAQRLKNAKYDMDVFQQMNEFAKRNPKAQVMQTEAEAKAQADKQKRYEERLNNAKNPTALPKFNNSTAAAVDDIVNPNSRVVKNSIETERDIDEAKKLNEARTYRNKVLDSLAPDYEIESEAKKNTTMLDRRNVSSALNFSDNDNGRRQTADNELNLRRYNALPQGMQQQIYEHLNGGTPIIRDKFVADIESSGVMTAKDAEELLDWAEGKYVEGTTIAQFTDKHPIEASIASVPMNAVGGMASAADTLGYFVADKIAKATDSRMSESAKDDFNNSNGVSLANAVQEMRSRVSAKIQEKGGDVAAFGYNTLMSMADSAFSMALGGTLFGSGAKTVNDALKAGEAASLFIMGTNAGSNTALEVLNEGGNINNAVLMGAAAGTFEALFEKVSIDRFTDKVLGGKSGRKVWQMIVNTAWQSFTEGSEELATDIANETFDWVANGKDSKLMKLVDSYKEKGYSESSAYMSAVNELFVTELGPDFLAGALSGAVFGGFGSAAVSVANRSSYQSMGRQLKAKTESAVKDGAETTPIDELRAVADRYGVKYKKAAERMSDVALGKFKADVYDKVNEKGKQEIISAYAARIKELDGDSPLKAKNSSTLMRAADRVANDRNYNALGEIVAKASVGRELTKTEKARLDNNAAAKQVLYEIETVTHGKKIIRPVDIDSLYDENLKYPAANMALYAAKKYKKGSAEYNSLTKAANELREDNEALSDTAAQYLSIADTAVRLLRQEKVSDERYNTLFTSREGLQVFSDLHKLFTANAVTFTEDMSEEERIRYICNSYDPTDPRYSWLNKVSEAIRKADAAYGRLSNTNYLHNMIFGNANGADDKGSTSGTASVNNVNNSLFSQYEDGLGDNGRAMLGKNATSINYATDEQRQIYADRMKMAYNNAMNGYSLQRVIDEGKRYGLSEKQSQAAYEAGKADRAIKVKQLDEAINSRRGAARIRSGNLYINDEQLGMLNDVGNRHLQSLEAVSAALGLDIRIVTDKEASDLMMNSKAKGMYSVSRDCIYIPIDSLNNTNQSVLYTLGHEVTHFIQDYSPAAYEDLRNYVIEHINKAAENGGADIAQQIAGKIKFYEAMGQSLTEEEALDEIVAEYFCDMLDNNELIGQMAAENYNLFEKVCKALSDFIERIRNTLHELMNDPRLKRDAQKYRGVADLDSDFAEMQALWNTALERAVAAHSQVDGEVNNENVGEDRYALSDNFDEEFDKAKSNDEYYQNNVLVLGKLPKLFAKFGLNTELYLTITAKHIRDITTEKSKNNTAYHGLTKDNIKKALLNLEKPAFIISSHKNDGTIIAVTTEQDSEGLPISIYVKPNGNAYINGVSETTNHATSIYARDNTYNYIKKSLFDSRVLDINEKEVNRLENILGVYFPDNILSVDFNKSIAYYKTLVNRDYAQNSENNTNSVDEGKYSFGDEDEQYLQAVENADTETAQRLVDEAAKRAGYDIKAYHGTPNGNFTVFRDWQYFTENKDYADVYQNQGASSNGYKTTARNKKTYSVYLNLEKVFDTRNQTEREIFENEFYGQWGNGAPLSDKGLPDWTDGYDFVEFFEEKGYDYDAILIDEGGTGGYGDDVENRGISIVVKNSSQIKSADPITYDDNGNVIPLSERFDSKQDDIRYSFGDEDEQYIASNAVTDKHKSKQLEIILNSNPALNDYSTWIRKAEDILSYEETLNDSDWEGWENDGFDPDYSGDMAKRALESGRITVYSSYPIENGVFVTPSAMEAMSYSGDGKIYSKNVKLTDVAWIDPTQGQYAKVETENAKDGKYSFGDEDEQLLNDLDSILDNEDGQYSTQKDAYGKKVKHRVNSIEKYAESEAIRREAEDSLVNAGGKRAGEREVARAKSDAAIKIGNASKDEINANPSKIERQNSQLKFENAELKRQMKPGVYAKGVKSGSVMELAKRLVRETKLSAHDIARRLNTAYKNISLNYGKVTDSVRKYLQSIAETIYFNASVKQVGDEFEDIKAILKSGTMTLAPQDRADMGDYNAFRQKYQNSLGLRNEGGTSVDSRYEELSAKYPYLFPDSITHPADRLKKIAEVYDSQKPRMVNPYEMSGYSKQDIIDGMVNQFINEYNEKKAADPTFVDKAIEALNKEKARLNEQYQKRVAENREEYLKRARKEAEADKEQYRLYREEREKTQTKKQIRRLSARLEKYLVEQTKRAYVPKELYEQVAQIVKMLDLSLTTSEPDSRYNKGLKNSFELISKLQNVFGSIKDSGLVLAGDSEAVDMVKANLEELQKAFVDEQGNAVNINALDSKQLHDVYAVLRDVTDIIRDSVHDIAVKDAKAFIDSADEFSNQQMSIPKKDKKAVKNDMFGFELMSPVRFAKMMDGYNINGEMSRRVEQLAVGQRETAKWRMMAYKLFDDYENGQKADWYYKAGSEKIETHLLGNEGEKVELTKMQIMQLIMSYEREVKNEKLNHLMRRKKPKVGENSTGGAILFDSAEWNKGHYDKAVQKAVRIGRLSENDIAKLKGLLDDEALRFMSLCKNFFANVSAPDVNKVTLLMHKGMPAIEESYVPFVVDKLYVHKSDISAADAEQFQTIESSGFLKSITPNASQPLDIMGLDVLVKQHIEQAAKVVGLAIPIRNFNNFYNCKTNISFDGAEQTVESIIQRNWGKKGNEAIKKMIADLQRPREVGRLDKAISKARGLMVSKALVGNISVVIKQAASYFTAGDEISAKSLAKASPTFLQRFSAKYYKSLCDEIDAHTATHYERRKGMSTQELGDIAQSITLISRIGNKAKYSKIKAVRAAYDKLSKLSPYKWIQGMDCLTTAALWNAAKYEVQSLNKGIDTNSKLYWDKVTELYDRTIENTQPMYDALHKTEVSKNNIVKSIVMFQTQPLQNYGILRERFGELKYAYRSGEGKAAAKRNFAKAAISQTVSLAVFAAMSFIATALVMHRWDRYRENDGEKNGEVTFNSIAKTYLSDLAQNGMNLVIPVIGSNIWELCSELINGESFGFWKLGDNVLEFANDYIDEFQNTLNAFNKYNEEDNLENKQKLGKQLRKDIEMLLALGHIPAENLDKLFTGIYQNVRGVIDWKNGGDYNNWLNYGYDMPYGEYDMLGNDDDSRYIRKEADRLSDSLGIDEIKLDNAAEKSVTVHGESKKLSRDEYEQYSKTKSDYCKQLLLKVMKSGTYGQLSDGLKAEAVNEAKSLGGTMAKGEVIDGYSTDGYEKAKALEQYGVPLEDQILSKVATATSDDEESNNAVTMAKVENKKALDSNGDGSVTVKEKIAAIEKLDISDGVKQLLIAYYKANAKKKKELIGMSGEE